MGYKDEGPIPRVCMSIIPGVTKSRRSPSISRHTCNTYIYGTGNNSLIADAESSMNSNAQKYMLNIQLGTEYALESLPRTYILNIFFCVRTHCYSHKEDNGKRASANRKDISDRKY